MTAIIRTQPADFDALVWAYWIMFCRAPKKAEPEADGFYDLSEIGSIRAKNWTRATVYSPAKIRGENSNGLHY